MEEAQIPKHPEQPKGLLEYFEEANKEKLTEVVDEVLSLLLAVLVALFPEIET